MSLSATSAQDIQLLFWNNTTWANVGDAAGIIKSTADGNFYISLHTADPSAGDQTTSEATYTNYARVAVTRDAAGWTVAAGAASNTAAIAFPMCGVVGNTITHVVVGRAAAGAGEIIVSSALAAPLVVALAITPTFAIGAVSTLAS